MKIQAAQPSFTNQDLFVLTEQNCQLQDKLEDVNDAVRTKDKTIDQLESQNHSLEEQLDRFKLKVSDKDDRLKVAN